MEVKPNTALVTCPEAVAMSVGSAKNARYVSELPSSRRSFIEGDSRRGVSHPQPPVRTAASVRGVVTWLRDRSEQSVRDALRVVAPQLAEGRLVLHDGWVDTGNPMWSRSTAFVDDRWVVKFAWTEVAAAKLVREGAVIEALGAVPGGPPVAPLAARSSEPAMFVAPLQAGRPLGFEHTANLDPAAKRSIARAMAEALAALHHPAVLAAIGTLADALPAPTPQAGTDTLRTRLAPLLDERRARLVRRWCDWADDVLAAAAGPVLLHGDFHGYNVIFDDRWRVVRLLDFEEASVGDRHYDFRYLPAQEATVELFELASAAYQQSTGMMLDRRRVMAWHVRTVLGDALWRTEAQVALPAGGSPSAWIDELADRFDRLGVTTDC
jgi:aminoglycoside phosphotransferase (APT) family kinase protein